MQIWTQTPMQEAMLIKQVFLAVYQPLFCNQNFINLLPHRSCLHYFLPSQAIGHFIIQNKTFSGRLQIKNKNK